MKFTKLLKVLKEKKVIKDFKLNSDAVKITLNNDDTFVLDYYGDIVMQSFKKQGE